MTGLMPLPAEQRPVPPDASVRPGDLAPGRVVYRWTDQAAAGVFAPLPCHEGQAVKLDPHWDAVAVCRVCSATFDAELLPDADGGYTAQFVVACRLFVLSRAHRA